MDEATADALVSKLTQRGLVVERDGEVGPTRRWNARVKAAASNAPDVREEKIAELKRRIMEGKYKVEITVDGALAGSKDFEVKRG